MVTKCKSIYMELVYGTIFGVVLTKLVEYLWAKLLKYRMQSIVRSRLDDTFEVTNRILALDHGIPHYLHANITLRHSKNSFFIGVPAKYRDELMSFDFEYRPTISLEGNDDLERTFQFLNDSNVSSAIQIAASQVAEELILDLQNGETRFNNEMFGVNKVRSQRLDKDEDAGFTIDFYKTDYFTYRTCVKLYQRYNGHEDRLQVEKLQDLNKYAPFLASFGVGTFIIINQGNGDEVIVGLRSKGVVVDQGRYHFTMNEAFSMKDVDEYGQPSLSACLFRGLEEELGISPIFKKYISDYQFLDLLLGVDRFEMGITSIARIKLNATFTFNKLRECYSIAKDSKLETSALISIPVNKIDAFLKEHAEKISQGCSFGLKAINARYKAGYLREEI